MIRPNDEVGEEKPALPPRSRRRLFWWMLNGCWLVILGGCSQRQELGAFAWAAVLAGAYGGVVVGGFSLFPHQLPNWIDVLCAGNIREEFYDLMWSSRRDLLPDRCDRTWVVPAIFGMVEFVGFLGVL